MIIRLAGEPFHIDPLDSLHRLTLREVLALYLAARQWKRDREADALEVVYWQVEGQIAISGITQERVEGYNRYMKRLAGKIAGLRAPEVEPDILPADLVLSPADALVMYGSKGLAEKGTAADAGSA